jgi:hypothetical protein
MNKVAGDDESIQNSIPEEELEEQQKELPKRSSVVDIWRKREGPGGSNKKEKISPVSVPWPDEEEEKEESAATSSTPTPPIHVQPKRTPPNLQHQQFKSTPSWKSQLKIKAPKPVEEKEADLTILPSTSTDHDEEVVTAASHSKSVMDVWTKRALTIADSPVKVEEDDVSVVSTPARSSVVDIWTKRTTSGDVATKRSTFEKAAAAPPLTSEAKKESPLMAWNKRETTSVVVAKDEEEIDLVVVQDDEKQQESESPKASSAANRYKQLAQLRHVPPKPVESRQDDTLEFEEPKPLSVVNRWKSQLRKTQVKPPSPVTTEPTTEDDEHTEASAIEEPKPSNVINRWKPRASGESPQLRKTHLKPSSTVTAEPTIEDDEHTEASAIEEPKPSNVVNRWKSRASGESPQLRKAPVKVPSPEMPETADKDDNKFEEPKRSSVMNRWNPQGKGGASSQLRNVAQTKAPSPVVTRPAIENVEESEPEAIAEESMPSNIASRWNPQGSIASPPLRKMSTKDSPVVVAEPPAEDAEGEREPQTKDPKNSIRSNIASRWNPQGNIASPPLRKVSTKVSPIVVAESPADVADGEGGPETNEPNGTVTMPKRSTVAGRWNPQGTQASSQLRKVPVRLSMVVETAPSTEDTGGDEEADAGEQTRSVVTNRWNPKGSLASPQLRKVINKVATPLGAERSVIDGDGDRNETAVTTETEQDVVVNRWKPQGTEASPQLRKAPFKRPPAIITELATENAVNQSEPTTEEVTRPSSVANRWNPQGNSSQTKAGPSRSSVEPAREHKKPSVLDRYNPQRSEANSRTQEFPSSAAQVLLDESGSSSVPPAAADFPRSKRSVLDRYKPKANHSEQNMVTDPPSFGFPVSTKGVIESTGEESGDLDQMSRSDEVHVVSTEESSPDAKQLPEINKPVSARLLPGKSNDVAPEVKHPTEPFEQPYIEPVISLPFDESPTTKLFASIDMSKSSGSTDLTGKADDNKVYDSTDADGFPTSSIDIAKSGEALPSGEDSCQSNDKIGAQKEDKLDDGPEIKAFVSQQPENVVVESKPVNNIDQRSKAMELFASRRKCNHVVNVQMNDTSAQNSKPPLVEKPVPKSPAASSKALASSGTPPKANATDTVIFQTGTSAFVPSPKEAEAVNALKGSTRVDSAKQRKRPKRPKSMKEFLQKHRRKSVAPSYDTISSRSSASVGASDASEKGSTTKKSNLHVNTTNERTVTSEASSFSIPTSQGVASTSEPSEDNQDEKEVKSITQTEATPSETDTALSLAGETEEYIQDNEPGRIISAPAPKPQENEPKSDFAVSPSPSPRTRTLRDRRRAHKHGFLGSSASPKSLASPATKKKSTPLREKGPRSDNMPIYPALKPVYQTNYSTKERSPIPSQGQPTPSWISDQTTHSSADTVPKSVTTDLATSSSARQYAFASQKPVKPNSSATVSDAGASDTLSFFSAASSTYASTAISSLSVDSKSLISPTSSLSNRASRAVVRRRRSKPSKEEDNVVAQELAQRVTRQTIHERPPSASDKIDEPSSFVDRSAAEKSGPVEDHFSGPPTVPENDIPRGPGLSGRYNTSSRFMDSVKNLMKGEPPNASFDSGTTEGSSQIRSVDSTSDSEGWMSRRARKSTSSLNRVPSDSTDGVSLQSSSVVTSATNNSKKGDVVTDYFVSESSSNLEALKSAYEAVSLHQIAMDLTDEVSVATNVDLKKIASNFNDSLRTGLSSLNGGSSTAASKKSPPRNLKVPTASSESRPVEEEVAIEVEYMEDSDDEEDEEIDSPIMPRHSSESENKKEESALPAGEPSQESSADRRRAYV